MKRLSAPQTAAPRDRGRLAAALAFALALLFAITSVVTVAAQDEAIAVDSTQRDWRLVMLVQDGAMVPVADVMAADKSEPTEASPVPSESPTARTLVLGVPTLSLEDDQRAGGWTGCNAWTASYTLDGDAVALGPVAVTRAACPQPAGALEAAFLDDLERVAAWAILSDRVDPSLELLGLLDAAGEQLLVFEPQPASPVLGSWQVTAYRDAAGAVVPSLPGELPTATFDTDGLVTGVTGCNQYGAEYRVDGQALIVGTPFVTSAGCEEPLAAQQQAFLAALEASARASMLSATTLLLTDDLGSATLILESMAPIPDPTPSPSPSPSPSLSPSPTPTPTPTPTPSPTPARVRVPDLRGKTEADAITALNDVDLLVGDRKRRFNATLAVGIVIRTEPEAGTRVKQASRVDLFVSKGPEPTATPKPKPKPTPKPTAKPTPKPTPRPTPKPTPRPTPTPDPGQRLDGSSWVLRDYRDSSGNNGPLRGERSITADFDAGAISGFGGCNTYSGSYTTNGSRISITGFATTNMLCDADAMTAEATYLAALGDVDAFRFRTDDKLGELLVLTGPDDQTRLRYTVP